MTEKKPQKLLRATDLDDLKEMVRKHIKSGFWAAIGEPMTHWEDNLQVFTQVVERCELSETLAKEESTRMVKKTLEEPSESMLAEVMWNRYFLPGDGETIEDAISFREYQFFKKVNRIVEDESPDYYADEAAIHHYNSSAGECGPNFKIAVVNTNHEVKLFEVEIEFEPVAIVSEVESEEATQ